MKTFAETVASVYNDSHLHILDSIYENIQLLLTILFQLLLRALLFLLDPLHLIKARFNPISLFPKYNVGLNKPNNHCRK